MWYTKKSYGGERLGQYQTDPVLYTVAVDREFDRISINGKPNFFWLSIELVLQSTIRVDSQFLYVYMVID